ncbi:trans-sialidase [Trypanosoma cruzi]|nr:trans-sialidase [Trypanosoma cruzi]
MSRHLFYSAVLLVLVMMCCGSGGAAEGPEQPSDPNYKWKEIKDEGETVESLGAPGLLNLGSDVFAVAEAQCKKNSENSGFTGIASQLLTEKKHNTPVEIMNGAKKDTQVLEEDASTSKKVDVSRPTAVVKGNDIYMLVGKYSQTDATGENRGADDWGILLVRGEVGGEENNKKIEWKNTEIFPRGIDTRPDSWTKLIGSGGSGVKMNDDTLVFPVEGTKKENKDGDAPNDGKTVSLLIYSSEDTNSWTLSKGMSEGGCSDPSVVEWEKDKKLMMMTACDDGRRRVYESGDKGESWTEALGALSRVWGNKQGEGAKGVRSGFITATIGDDEDKRNVMLVTLPVYPKRLIKKKRAMERENSIFG